MNAARCPDCHGSTVVERLVWSDDCYRSKAVSYDCMTCAATGMVDVDPLEGVDDMGPDVAPIGVAFVDVLRIAHELGDVDADSIVVAVASLRKTAA